MGGGYLILSRRTNERLLLLLPNGERVEILVADITYDKVDIGVKAPRNIKILKMETHMKDLVRGHGSSINNKPR